MLKSLRIFIVTDISYNPVKMFLDQMHKLSKGFVRLGHDARVFSYRKALLHKNPLKGKTFSKCFFKSKADILLIEQIKNYKPDIVYITFARLFDDETIEKARCAAAKAVFIGCDPDPWPELHPQKLEIAKKLDILTATNDGKFLQTFRDSGAKHCVFMPNVCDPDIDHHYEVGPEWKSDILWVGTTKHHADTSETFREKLVTEIYKRPNSTLYGCFGRPQISGQNYLYAISGAKISVNVNAYASVKFCHSDRLTQHLACGTFVLAKRFEGCNMLYKDKVHLRYFETIEEFFDLADWYLSHESERKKIADAGMQWVHEQFNSVKIAGYILELVKKSTYSAPWL